MKKITKTQRLSVFVILAISLAVVFVLKIDKEELNELICNVVLSVCASAVYFYLHSAVVKNEECEEIALLAIGKLNPSYPVKYYEATNEEDTRFSNDIEKDLKGKNSDYIYYEGVTIKTFSKCLVNSFSSSNWNQYPHCYFIISKASILELRDCKELLKSIICLRKLCQEKQELKLLFCILDYHVPFHIHLTEKRVWFSPFKGNNIYPTTFLYEKNDSVDSYYRNLKNMMLRILDPNSNELLTLGGCSNNSMDDKAQMIKILQKLEVVDYNNKNRKYCINPKILSNKDMKNDDSIIHEIEEILK